MKAVLNVGGSSKAIPIPKHYYGWRHDLLDIDPAGKPDVCMDARELEKLPAESYDAVYCAHNLEHYHRHEGAKVLRGFHHILRTSGFAEIHVPNLEEVISSMVRRRLDIDDVLYMSPKGPILVRDSIYGYHREIEESGQDFYAHKTGFTPKALTAFMAANGFPYHLVTIGGFEIQGLFFKQPPQPEEERILKLRTRTGLFKKLTDGG